MLVHFSRRRRTYQQSVGSVRDLLPANARAIDFRGQNSCGTVACSFMAYHMVRSVVALSSMFLAYSLDSARFSSLRNLPNGGCQTYPLFGHAMRHIYLVAIWARDTIQHATCQTSCGKESPLVSAFAGSLTERVLVTGTCRDGAVAPTTTRW